MEHAIYLTRQVRQWAKRALPKPLITLYRSLRDRYEDTIDQEANRINGKSWLPPIRLRREVGSLAAFESVGTEQFIYLRLLCDLKPNERLLDIGCGCGRVTTPLTGYLSAEGRYVGMDVSQDAIAWCSQNITPRHPNFTFFRADLRNTRYNPSGQLTAAEYRFPLEDGSFDLIHLRSVFTHLNPADTQNYLAEIARLLAPEGRCLATFNLFDRAQALLASHGLGVIGSAFPFGNDDFRYANELIPEAACAYRTDYLEALLAGSDLRLLRPRIPSRWSGRPDWVSGQDILLLEQNRIPARSKQWCSTLPGSV
jgi:SAM-dependent methyltransferase